MYAGMVPGCATGVTLLSHLQPMANGAQRRVFQHPDHPELLVKVLRREFLEPRFGPQGSFHNRHRRCRQHTQLLRELQEYLVACARSAQCLPNLQEIVGLLHTDLGLGLVVRKVCGPDGGPAPTLARLIEQGALDETRQKLLEAFLERLLDSDIVVDDMNPGNIVLAVDGSGTERFVLIDGMGSSTFIPLKGLVPAVNVWSKRRYFMRLRAQIAEALQKRSRAS